MNRIFLFLAFLFLVLLSEQAVAQVKASNEPRVQLNSATGEMIIMPNIPSLSDVAPVSSGKASAKSAKTAKHVRQPRKREAVAGKKVNGYYVLDANRNWGTNYRLGHYGLARM